MRGLLQYLEGLSSEELVKHAVVTSRAASALDWDLCATFLALDRRGIHREEGFSSLVRYAEVKLEMHPGRAYELLRVARALEALPQLSEALRTGGIGWAKAKAISRVAKPEDEASWLIFAQAHTATEVERATVLSPRQWDRQVASDRKASSGQAEFLQPGESDTAAGSQDHAPADTRETMSQTEFLQPGESEAGAGSHEHPVPDNRKIRMDVSNTVPGSHASGENMNLRTADLLQPGESSPTGAAGPPVTPPADGQQVNTDGSPDKASNGPKQGVVQRPGSTAPPAGPKPIRFAVECTPEEWTILSAAKRAEEARAGHKLSLGTALARALQTGSPTGKQARNHVNSILLVHVRPETGTAWTEDDNRVRPADPALVEDALCQGKVAVVDDPIPAGLEDRVAPHVPIPESGSASPETQSPTTEKPMANTVEVESGHPEQPLQARRPRRRTKLTVALVEALYIRAHGRCQGCGGSGPFHVDHLRPWSEWPKHEFHGLQLLCGACHALRHERDFARRESWREARRRAMEARQQYRLRSSTLR